MPFLTAYALDRANEWLVSRRLSGRMEPPEGPPVAEYLAGLDAEVHPAPGSRGGLEPVCAGGRLWRAASPWSAAGGRNAQWYAERLAPLPAGRASAVDAAPSLILLHGWLIDRPQLIIYRSWARSAANRGFDVWMPRLPHHLERAEPGEVSGQRCLSPDLVTSLDAVRQAVAEVRELAAWLRRRGAPKIGVWGMSLGGWIAALAAIADPDWDALALWAPVASPVEVLFESKLVELLRDAVVDGGVSKDDLRTPHIGSMSPDSGATRVPRSRVLIVAGAYDRVISPRSVARLARTWNVDVHWVPHGHISLMCSRAPIRDTVAFLQHALC